MSGTSGPRSGVSLARFDPDTCCLKMPQVSFPGMEVPISREYSASWPHWGSLVNGECWERTTPVLRTSGRGSGYWPTLRATDGTHGGLVTSRKSREGGNLIEAVNARYWPTPQAHDAGAGNAARVGRYGTKHGGRNLNDWAAMWPTPTASDCIRGSTGWINDGKRGHQLPESAGGALNPEFVEFLMGWPRGFSGLEPLAPEAFTEWLATSRGPWPNEWDVPRIRNGVPNRTQRLKALGNGQVPQCMAMAWLVLMT